MRDGYRRTAEVRVRKHDTGFEERGAVSLLIHFGSPVILNGQSQLPAVDGVSDPQTQLQVLVRQAQQHL